MKMRSSGTEDQPKRKLTPEAQRALAEAEQRRKLRDKATDQEKDGAAREVNGRGGLDPVRYGDWEVKGIISDF